MQIMTYSILKAMRRELGVSQEDVARRTRTVSIGTVRNAEEGKNVTFNTATQLVEAINAIRKEKGMSSSVTLDDLGLKLH